MSLAVRFLLLVMTLVVLPVNARELRILVIGDGAAANCNGHQFTALQGVMQIGLDGNEKPAHDPLDWAGCKGGSIWILLGNELIRQGKASKVVFMPIAIPNARVRDFQAGGAAFALLTRAMSVMRERHLRFDYAFWQQSFADEEVHGKTYRNDLNVLIKLLSRTVSIHRWLIARGADCSDGTTSDVATGQDSLARAHLINQYSGPEAEARNVVLQTNGCTFNQAGQAHMAQAWLEAMDHTDVVSNNYQRESLLYWFK